MIYSLLVLYNNFLTMECVCMCMHVSMNQRLYGVYKLGCVCVFVNFPAYTHGSAQLLTTYNTRSYMLIS